MPSERSERGFGSLEWRQPAWVEGYAWPYAWPNFEELLGYGLATHLLNLCLERPIQSSGGGWLPNFISIGI